MEIIELLLYGLGLLSWRNEKPELIIDKQLFVISIVLRCYNFTNCRSDLIETVSLFP